MKYSKMLRDKFPEIILTVKDLFILESFQIKYLPDRLPKKEFSVLLHSYPQIKDYLLIKQPEIENFISTVLKEHKKIVEKDLINEHCNELLWEIADLIIFNKYPGIVDSKCDFSWNIDDIIAKESLSGKVVADVGAGSGKLTFLLSKYAKTVYAIEPLNSFRNFIREKKIKEKINNVYVTDGFLNSIPFPDNYFDILMTSNAIGWDLENELIEIERVVKPKGQVVHIMRVKNKGVDNPFHDTLISRKWGYKYFENKDDLRLKLKYHKIID